MIAIESNLIGKLMSSRGSVKRKFNASFYVCICIYYNYKQIQYVSTIKNTSNIGAHTHILCTKSLEPTQLHQRIYLNKSSCSILLLPEKLYGCIRGHEETHMPYNYIQHMDTSKHRVKELPVSPM